VSSADHYDPPLSEVWKLMTGAVDQGMKEWAKVTELEAKVKQLAKCIKCILEAGEDYDIGVCSCHDPLPWE
jgi:hypothetical protein